MKIFYFFLFLIVTIAPYNVSVWNAQWKVWAAIYYGALSVFFIETCRELNRHRDIFCPSFEVWQAVKKQQEAYEFNLPWQARAMCGGGSVVLAASAGLATFSAGVAFYLGGGNTLRMIRRILTGRLTSDATSTHPERQIVQQKT